MGARKHRTAKSGGHGDRKPPNGNRNIGQCRVTGKLRYLTKSDAKTVARMTGLKVSVYTCEACGSYELGGNHGLNRDQHRANRARRRAQYERSHPE